eukprot:5390166-Prymnesium_polylepis.1
MQRREAVIARTLIEMGGVHVRQEQLEKVDLVPAAKLVQRRQAEHVAPLGVHLTGPQQPHHLVHISGVLHRLGECRLSRRPLTHDRYGGDGRRRRRRRLGRVAASPRRV